MKLFVVTGPFPPIFFKAEDRGEALEKFGNGINSNTLRTLVNHKDFMVREVTIPLLMTIAPDEFRLDDDTNF